MTLPPDFQSLLDALSEPALVLHTSGAIKCANLAASSLLGKDVEGRNLIELETEDRERLRLYLRRCSGSRQRTIGKMSLRGEDGVVRSLRCKGCLLRPANGAPGSALLFINYTESDDRFSILARQIRDLNAEMHKRSHLQAVLEQSLRRHDLLMRELHHRVGNNLQMISGMLSAARSELESPEARSALTRASQRIGAIAAAQQIFRNLAITETIFVSDVIRTLCTSLEQSILADRSVSLNLESIQVSNDMAVPIALILNELLTNAVQYSGNGISIDFIRTGDEIVLSVQDEGPGFDLSETSKRASGLGLVRGLARQMGGTFEVERRGGARCTIRMKTCDVADQPQ